LEEVMKAENEKQSKLTEIAMDKSYALQELILKIERNI